MPGELPANILESIAIANAKSVGEQPAILANLALANLINNTNLAQQTALANIQAANSVILAIASKSAETILSAKSASGDEVSRLRELVQVMDILRNGSGDLTNRMHDTVRDHLEHTGHVPPRPVPDSARAAPTTSAGP